MNIFYGGMPGKDFLISKYFDSRAELQNKGSSKHADLVTGDYVLIYATNAKHIDYNNGELWQRISTPADPKYKANYKEVITVTDAFGYGLIGNLAGPQGYTPEVGDNEHWWIGDVDTKKPARGAGVREIVVANASYIASQWSTYGTHGKSNTWTATNDISKLEVGDIAFFTGKVTDEVDAQNNPIQAALFFVITAISGTSVTGTSTFVLKGSQGGIERIDTKTPTNIEGIVEGKGGVLQAATSIPTSLIDKNTVDKDGLVTKGSGHPNSLWSTDGSGAPGWRNLGYQNATQVQQIVDTAISKSGHAHFEKVDKVPDSATAKDNVLYLVYNATTKYYDIYAKVGTEVVRLDDTTVDLSNYVTNDALTAKNYATKTDLTNGLNNKVDKVTGKQLSTNDYTTNEKNKLSGIAAGAQVNVIEKVQVNAKDLPITNKTVNVSVPTSVSQLTNDSGYITLSQVPSGAAASNTVPKAPAASGVVGSETAFARGDHQHPLQTTVSGNAGTATKLALAKKINLAGDVTGSVSFDGGADVTLTTFRRGCLVGQSNNTAGSATWFKFASITITGAYSDEDITFFVKSCYAHNSKLYGILTAHIRTKSDGGGMEGAELVWNYAGPDINVNNFVMAYSTTSPFVYELWVNCNESWLGYRFDVISEGTRTIRNTHNWTLYNNYVASGQTAPTSGYTQLKSTFSDFQTSAGTMTGDLTLSGATRNIKYASGTRTDNAISFYKGDEYGSGIVIGAGGRTIIGGGESASALKGALGSGDANEEMHIANDGTIQFHVNCQTITNRKTLTIQSDARISGVANPTANTDVANKQYVDTKVPVRVSQLTNDSNYTALTDAQYTELMGMLQ